MPLQPRSKFTAPRYAAAKARASKARSEAKRRLEVKKYEAWALKYTPSRPAAGGRAIVPSTIRRKLLFTDTQAYNPAAGVVSYGVYLANGLYDPRVGVGGGQPRGFDQYMGLYNHFKVVASKIIVETFTQSTTSVMLLCQSSDGAASSATAVSDWIERPQTSWKSCINYRPIAQIANDFVLSRDLPTQKNDADLQGHATADPTELWYYNVAVGPDDEASDLGSHYVRVVIEYDVIFSGPISPAAS